MPLLRNATSPMDIDQVRKLFLEYQADIGVDLCFQGFAEELATLPGSYSVPLAIDDPHVVGCVALRPLSGATCEMKRLYVRPHARGRGLARVLATSVLDEARTAGYQRILLDTLPSMREAIALYRSLGFKQVPAYCHNRIAGALYFGLELQAAEF